MNWVGEVEDDVVSPFVQSMLEQGERRRQEREQERLLQLYLGRQTALRTSSEAGTRSCTEAWVERVNMAQTFPVEGAKRRCRLEECGEVEEGVGEREGYCRVHWENLRSWLDGKH